jgi:RmlD substrate binding domain
LRINEEAPAKLARWAAPHEVAMVHFSREYVFKDYVFDSTGETPWRETESGSCTVNALVGPIGQNNSYPVGGAIRGFAVLCVSGAMPLDPRVWAFER